MAGYATKVKRDIARWLEAGMIDAATATTLRQDVERTAGRGISFGSVLAMMAASLFGAAILLVVAANWDAIPRLVRVGLLFAIIIAGYVGGALLKRQGRDGAAQAAWVVAAVSFGASIALIGQMYHMSGDEKQAVLVWCIGTALAAGALRSHALNVGAVLLAGAWMWMWALDHWSLRALPNGYLLIALLLYALSFWTLSRASRHLLLLSMALFGILYYWKDETYLAPLAMAAAGVALFAACHSARDVTQRLFGLGSGLSVHALIFFLAGVGIVQWELMEEPEFLAVSVAAFAGILAALLLAGRDNSMLRWLAYGAFIFQLGYIYIVMLGTMLGTAGFFLIGGLVLSGLAWFINRLERRYFGSGEPAGGAA